MLNNRYRSHEQDILLKRLQANWSIFEFYGTHVNELFLCVSNMQRQQNHCLYKCNHCAIYCVTNPFLALLSYCIGGVAIGTSHGKGMSVGMNGSKWKPIKIIIITCNLAAYAGGSRECKLQSQNLAHYHHHYFVI